MSLLVNYEGLRPSSINEVLTNFVLKPLIIGIGREVKVRGINEEQRTFTTEKSHHIALRVLAFFSALALSVVTFAALVARALSSEHQKMATQERRLVEAKANRQTEVSKFLETTTHLLDGNGENIQSLIDGMSKINSFFKEAYFLNQIQIDNLKSRFLTCWGALKTELHDLDSLSPETLRQLKRLFSSLKLDQSTMDNDKHKLPLLPFSDYHQKVRSHYYTHHASHQMVAKLQEKGQLTILQNSTPATSHNATLQQLCGENEGKEGALQSIKEAFSHPTFKPTKATWLHGTNSSTLVGVTQADNLLKSGGQIRTDGGLAFAGEHNQGINQEHISGVPLSSSKVALDYTTPWGAVSKSDADGVACCMRPVESINYYANEVFKEHIDKLNKDKTLKDAQLTVYYTFHQEYTAVHDSQASRNLANLLRHMRILCSLEPEKFREQIVPPVQQLIEKLETLAKKFEQECPESLDRYHDKARDAIKLMLQPISKMTPAHTYSEEERALIQSSYPVVFASTQLKLVVSKESLPNQTAKLKNPILNEYVHKGSLKLGKDLPLVFVPQSRITQTREFLQDKQVKGVHVFSIAALRVASCLEEYQKRKLEKNS